MPGKHKLRVVLIKPSKYAEDGFAERFRWGIVPNTTLTYLQSMTLDHIRQSGECIEPIAIDEYVQDNLDYLQLLGRQQDCPTLVALLGVQSHQFHRALDLAALARKQGALAVIGGPHVMTCDTTTVQNRGASFALAEADLIWTTILADAIRGELQPVYGTDQRWQRELTAPVIRPPSRDNLRRYLLPMLGIYPARGCPFRCSFCSVIKIAGRKIRSQTIETSLQSLWEARTAGVRLILFASDNFNKIPQVRELLDAMRKANLGLRFFVQCDAQIGGRDRDLIPLLAQAGCFQIFVGVESFNRSFLLGAQKSQNHPDSYGEIVRVCREHRIGVHFSNIIGFPGETETEILEQLRVVRRLNPAQASFFILTPIPGTELYDDFQAKGLIFERNLDRFDTTCETWSHDVLPPKRLKKLLYHCYNKFYSSTQLVNLFKRYNREDLTMTLFSRLLALKKTHPMAGGVWRIKLDHVDQYLKLREETFGLDHVPLPPSLPTADESPVVKAPHPTGSITSAS